MHLPYSLESYIALIAYYNTVIWPGQMVTGTLALACVLLPFIPGAQGQRACGIILAMLWAFVAIAFYHMHLSRLSFMAPVYTGAFLVQAVLIVTVTYFSAFHAIRITSHRVRTGLAIALMGLLGYPGLVLAIDGNWQAFRAPGAAPGTLVFLTTGFVLMAGLSSRARAIVLAIPMLYSAAAVFTCWYIWGRLLV